jgi:hypothetical protein
MTADAFAPRQVRRQRGKPVLILAIGLFLMTSTGAFAQPRSNELSGESPTRLPVGTAVECDISLGAQIVADGIDEYFLSVQNTENKKTYSKVALIEHLRQRTPFALAVLMIQDLEADAESSARFSRPALARAYAAALQDIRRLEAFAAKGIWWPYFAEHSRQDAARHHCHRPDMRY